MTREEFYINAHPETKELFDMIQAVKNCDNVAVTVTTGSPRCLVVNKLENPRIDIAFFAVNNVDEATLLIHGQKTYSFELKNIKINSTEYDDAPDGVNYKIKLTQLGQEYELIFLIQNPKEGS